MSRNLRNTAVSFGERVLGGVMGAVGMFFVARQMPNADFHIGVVGFALSFVGMFLAIQRAFDTAHVKRISEGRDLATCNGTYLFLNLGATLGMVGLVLGGVWVWTDLLGQGFQTPMHERAIQLLLIYQVLNSVGEFTRRTFEGQQNIVLGQIVLSTEHIIKGAATIYVAYFGLSPVIDGARNALGLSTAYVLGAAALALIAVLMVIGQPFGKPSWSLAKSYVRYGGKTTATATIRMIAMNSGAMIVQLFWSARDVGYYWAPQRYIQFLPAIAGAAGTTLFPLFSEMHAGGRTVPREVERILRWVSLILLPIVAVSLVLPEAVIHVLLSDRFLPAAPVMAIMAVGFYLKALQVILSTKLSGMNLPGKVTKAAFLSMISMLTLGVVFVAPSLFGVPFLGLKAPGAAIALALSQGLELWFVFRATREHAGVQLGPLAPNLVRHGVMLLGTTVALFGLTQLVDPLAFRFFHLVLAAGLSATVFFGLGVIVGEVEREEVRRARELADPRGWLGFLGEELSPPEGDDTDDEEEGGDEAE